MPPSPSEPVDRDKLRAEAERVVTFIEGNQGMYKRLWIAGPLATLTLRLLDELAEDDA